MLTALFVLINLIIPIALSAIEVQYSTDNSTWINVTSIDEGLAEAYQINLQGNTQYYFRARNGSTAWQYISRRTKTDGETTMATLSVAIFLIGINLVVFLLPLIIKKFHHVESTDYVIKRLLWILSIMLLWFNTTIFRTIAENNSMGIDDMLAFYWWMFTMGAFISVFLICYTGLVGIAKMAKEVQMKKRLGDL